MTAQQPQKTDLLTSYEKALGDGIMTILKSLWSFLVALFKPLQPSLTAAEQAYSMLFNPIYRALGNTKLLDSLLGTIGLGLVILALALLAVRLAANA